MRLRLLAAGLVLFGIIGAARTVSAQPTMPALGVYDLHWNGASSTFEFLVSSTAQKAPVVTIVRWAETAGVYSVYKIASTKSVKLSLRPGTTAVWVGASTSLARGSAVIEAQTSGPTSDVLTITNTSSSFQITTGSAIGLKP